MEQIFKVEDFKDDDWVIEFSKRDNGKAYYILQINVLEEKGRKLYFWNVVAERNFVDTCWNYRKSPIKDEDKYVYSYREDYEFLEFKVMKLNEEEKNKHYRLYILSNLEIKK